MLRINLPVGGIEVLLDEKTRNGSVRSKLHTLDGSGRYKEYDAAISTIEMLVLNHASLGLPITKAPYLNGLKKAINEVTRKYSPRN